MFKLKTMKRFLALFLLIEIFEPIQGNIGNTSLQKQGFGPGIQDWGWYEVRRGAHMFYWLFYVQDPTVKSVYDRPLVIYLFGGPGISTTGFANFFEIGPQFTDNKRRPASWANHVNLLLIDNPVGTGYSYIEPGENYTSTNEEIGAEMLQFLIKFYEGHPEFVRVPLYIFGESFGGTMVVEIAKQLDTAIINRKLKANFKGIGLGDPWISPLDHLRTSVDVLLHVGVVDQQGHDRIVTAATKLIQKVVAEQKLTSEIFIEILRILHDETAGVNIYNYLSHRFYSEEDFIESYSDLIRPEEKCNSTKYDRVNEIDEIMNGEVRKSLGIQNERRFKFSNACVFAALLNENIKSFAHVVEEILTDTDLEVVVYNGQLDLVVSSLSTLRWLDRLKWPGSSKWKSAEREFLVIDGIIEGWIKCSGKLHFYLINKAEHTVPVFNPKAALEILKRFTKFDKPREV